MNDGIKMVLDLMEIAGITSPKCTGRSAIEVKKISEKDLLKKIGEEMIKYGNETGIKGYQRDGEGVKDCDGLFLIGIKKHDGAGLNCLACGHTCATMKIEKKEQYDGPNCSQRLIDLGIALGSAVKIASMLNVDNRIMYRIGIIVKKMGIMDCTVVYGVPLAVKNKNPFFDRMPIS